MVIQLTRRQGEILEIVKREEPITGEHIAEKLNLTRATLRPRVGYFYSGKSTHSLLAEKLGNFIVNDLKSLPVVITEQKTAYDAVVSMFTEDVGTLSVVSEQGYLEGILSRKDLLKLALGGSDLHQIPVGIVMTRMPNVITTTPEEPVVQAARKILRHEVDGLPVVRPVLDQGSGETFLEVIGRFTKTNITRLIVELVDDTY